MGRDQKDFEKHDRSRRGYLEQTVSTNIDIKDSTGEGSEENEMHYRENYIALENTYIDVNRLLVETRNMGIQDAVSESSKGNEEQVTENGDKMILVIQGQKVQQNVFCSFLESRTYKR